MISTRERRPPGRATASLHRVGLLGAHRGQAGRRGNTPSRLSTQVHVKRQRVQAPRTRAWPTCPPPNSATGEQRRLASRWRSNTAWAAVTGSYRSTSRTTAALAQTGSQGATPELPGRRSRRAFARRITGSAATASPFQMTAADGARPACAGKTAIHVPGCTRHRTLRYAQRVTSTAGARSPRRFRKAGPGRWLGVWRVCDKQSCKKA